MPKSHQYLALAVDDRFRILHLSGVHHTRDEAVKTLSEEYGRHEEDAKGLRFGLIPVEFELVTLEKPAPAAEAPEKTDTDDDDGGDDSNLGEG